MSRTTGSSRACAPGATAVCSGRRSATAAQRERTFPFDLTTPDHGPTPIQDARADRRRQADAVHAQALRRADTERARQPGAAPAVRSAAESAGPADEIRGRLERSA
ncbi:hypothetical protein [Streptomyces sp. NPDC059863]|uniref:hypothetical protein n=1 Tax=unclassified Streptomyces TaxID=2593676 RepID=UPI00365FF105